MREHLLLPVQLVRATPYHEGEIWLTTCCLFESSHHLSLADLCVCLLNEIVPLGFTEESQKVGNAMSSWCFLIIFYIIFLHNISFFFFLSSCSCVHTPSIWENHEAKTIPWVCGNTCVFANTCTKLAKSMPEYRRLERCCSWAVLYLAIKGSVKVFLNVRFES